MLSSVCIPYTCGAYLLATIIHVIKGSCPYHLVTTAEEYNIDCPELPWYLILQIENVKLGKCIYVSKSIFPGNST